jgi:hypothetical protein
MTTPQLIVIATRTETPKENWEVSFEEGKAFADGLGAWFAPWSIVDVFGVLQPAVEAIVQMRKNSEKGESKDFNTLKKPRDYRNLMQKVRRKLCL